MTKKLPGCSTAHPLPSIIGAVTTGLAKIRPLPFNRPRAKALMVGVVAGEMAVLDQTAARMTAAIVDGFELAHDEECLVASVRKSCSGKLGG